MPASVHIAHLSGILQMHFLCRSEQPRSRLPDGLESEMAVADTEGPRVSVWAKQLHCRVFVQG